MSYSHMTENKINLTTGTTTFANLDDFQTKKRVVKFS